MFFAAIKRRIGKVHLLHLPVRSKPEIACLVSQIVCLVLKWKQGSLALYTLKNFQVGEHGGSRKSGALEGVDAPRLTPRLALCISPI